MHSAMQENRVHTLRKEADHCITMAELIEYNLEDVDAAIKAVRVSLANGMSWEALARMIKEEKKAGNPVAGLIDKLSFEKNCITLLLSNNLDDMDEEEKTAPVEKVCSTNKLACYINISCVMKIPFFSEHLKCILFAMLVYGFT